jgi:hypothetical protein
MIERHQDYQLNLATLPVGGLENVELQLDTDASFAARLVKQRFTPTAVDGSWSYRFRTARGSLQSSDGGTGGYRFDDFGKGTLKLGNPIYPELNYPAGGSILIDLINNTNAPLTNIKLLFRGSKKFADGSIENYTYPDKASLIPYVYPVPGQFGNVITVAQTQNVRNNQMLVTTDADFALRYAWCDSFALTAEYSATYNQLYCMIRDQWNKAYSNVPIHIDDLFGSSNSVATGSADNAVYRPGIFTPEIYIPANGQLYFDLFRTDSAGGTVTLQFSFGGAKVYHR